MKRHFKRFLRRKPKHEGHPKDDPPEPVFLFAVGEDQPCDLCGDETLVKARHESSGIIWICVDAFACLRRQNFHVVD